MLSRSGMRTTLTVAELADLRARCEAAQATARALVTRSRALIAVARSRMTAANDRMVVVDASVPSRATCSER